LVEDLKNYTTDKLKVIVDYIVNAWDSKIFRLLSLLNKDGWKESIPGHFVFLIARLISVV
jgi:hypothetical protein